MNRKFSFAVLSLSLILALAGCMGYDRRTAPQVPGSQGMDNNGPMISATYEKADVEYVITTQNVSVKNGVSANSPVIYNLKSGTKIRVLAKYDGNYVAYLPNNRVGMIPVSSTKPATAAVTQKIPDVPQSTASPQISAVPQTPESASAPGIPQTNQSSAGNANSSEESSMLNLVNSERSKAGLKPLASNTELTKLARLKSKDIADKNYFSHTSPTYGTPFEMMQKYGVAYLYAGENLAKNSTVQAAHQALMNSEGHRKNILSNQFTEVGIGVITDEGNNKVYTQMFIGR
ncbi:cysteine-rich secretory protein family protein [Oxobacter pfennigii]|uniref:Cysteine-rich secretory protein family protein n=1 Tax=Oxobacter pfennigii TaxID=36849 RepID=A0A0P9AGH7_9CLOT|nr:CAP domain-containing protein [Oxobacter pfennigii]KPU44531.1 cysteine-rich secretory protein family protein [Oxobacter pfennigii]